MFPSASGSITQVNDAISLARQPRLAPSSQIPVSCVLTSASVHDSQVAIPLMTMTDRVSYLYDLMDAAYDAAASMTTARRSAMRRSSIATFAPSTKPRPNGPKKSSA